MTDHGASFRASTDAEKAARALATSLRFKFVAEKSNVILRQPDGHVIAEDPATFLQGWCISKLSPTCTITKEIARTTNDETYVQLALQSCPDRAKAYVLDPGWEDL